MKYGKAYNQVMRIILDDDPSLFTSNGLPPEVSFAASCKSESGQNGEASREKGPAQRAPMVEG